MAKLLYSEQDLKDFLPEASDPNTSQERLVQLRHIAETLGLNVNAVALKKKLYANPNAPLALFSRDRDLYRYADAIASNPNLSMYVLENPRFIERLIQKTYLPQSMQQEIYDTLKAGLEKQAQGSVGRKHKDEPMKESDLKYLLQQPGTITDIGPETGRSVRDGIAVFRSPRNSWRFVFMQKGKPLSVLHVIDLGAGKARVENVYTLPSHRSHGFGAKLLAEARTKWKELTHSKVGAALSNVGRATRRKVRKIKEEATTFFQDIQNAMVRRSWQEEGNPFHLEHLDYILEPKGEVPGIGPEIGVTKKNGISVFRSEDTYPHQSWRFTFSKKGRIIAALQVFSKGNGTATISVVYTDPDFRRKGIAEKLLKRARKQFKRVEHSALRSPAGNAWAHSVGLVMEPIGAELQQPSDVGAIQLWEGGGLRALSTIGAIAKKSYRYVGACLNAACGKDIRDMVAKATRISRETFVANTNDEDRQQVETALGYDRHMPISRAPNVFYRKSVYRGVPAYYLTHSAIEYIFTLQGKLGPSNGDSMIGAKKGETKPKKYQAPAAVGKRGHR